MAMSYGLHCVNFLLYSDDKPGNENFSNGNFNRRKMLDFPKLFDAYRQMIWTLVTLHLTLNYDQNKSSYLHVIVEIIVVTEISCRTLTTILAAINPRLLEN